jgi:hypothetical protein
MTFAILEKLAIGDEQKREMYTENNSRRKFNLAELKAASRV